MKRMPDPEGFVTPGKSAGGAFSVEITFHLQIIWLCFSKSRNRIRTEAEPQGGVDVYCLLRRAAGRIQSMSSPFQGFLSGGFKQGSADSAAPAIAGNMEAVNDEPAFVQRGNQHDFANHAISFKSAVGHVLPAENLFSFFGQTRIIPILREGIVNQCQIPILQAIHIFDFLIPPEAFQRIPGEVIPVNKLNFQRFIPFIVQ